MEMAKLTSKGQITIPKSVRDDLGVDTGDKLIFIKCEQGYLVCNGQSLSVPAAEVSLPQAAPAPARAPRVEQPVAYAAADEDDDWDERFKKADKADKSEKDKKKKKKKKK